VNEYLQETTGKPFTAKDFRTWGGSLLATQVLLHAGDFETMKEGRRRTVQAVKDVAAALGNTPATCRKYYIHPRVLELYETHELERAVRSRRLPPKEVRDHLRDGEIALWRVLTE
jgi:DNA topoisomerase-1